jgi:pimeloyl-ACP methyl ester carboxylesterase
VNKTGLKHLFIVIHGKLRDGDRYWTLLDNAINVARQEAFPGSDREVAVLAPQFFSTIYNSGQYTDDQLAWADLNAWQAGARATHPKDTILTSFDVLDGLITRHSDSNMYPNLKNITVVGHGGGGQLVQRYAAVGKDPPSHIHVRYVHGDASSCMYFTEDRPVLEGSQISKSSCAFYNTWRYGFDEFPGAGGVLKSPEEYFKQYTTRDVVSLVGYEDIGGGGDKSCMGRIQGGDNRRDRNLIWYRYINTLAGTDKDLVGFPGAFVNVPNWSHLTDGTSHLRLIVVENAGHNMEKLFEGNSGQAVLFNDSDINVTNGHTLGTVG